MLIFAIKASKYLFVLLALFYCNHPRRASLPTKGKDAKSRSDLGYIVENGRTPGPNVSPLFASNALSLANKAALLKGVVLGYNNMLEQQLQHAKLLISLINKEYDLDDE